jgi:histidyl-tRNA synthetase
MNDITVAIDKLDKIGLDKVKNELGARGLNTEQVGIIEKYLSIKGNNEEVIKAIEKIIGGTPGGRKGLDEIAYLLSSIKGNELRFDPTLARGLNYYTGVIFEAQAPSSVRIGSIGGGGRYDDLTGLFGVPGIPGVGISFGVDRIYDVMEELELFPPTVQVGTQVLFFNLGERESRKAMELAQELRNAGIRCEVFHENLKFDKQFKYAEKKNIPFIVIIGEKELADQTCTIKNLGNCEQRTVSMKEVGSFEF